MTIDSRQLRILMVAPTSFFADYGCHVRILEEIRALQARGHAVRLCTYHNGRNIPGIDIRRSVDVPWRKRVVVGSSRHKLYLDVVLALEVARQAFGFQPDIIHAHLHEGALIGGMLGKITGIPVIFDYQGSLTREMIDHGFLEKGSRLSSVVRWGESMIEKLPDRIITSSNNARQQLLDHYKAPGNVHTVLDAVDTSQFDPLQIPDESKRQLRSRYGVPDDFSIVVYLGLLAPYQGSDLLLSAARQVIRRHPKTYFLVMGFPGNERYRLLAEEFRISQNMSFPGRIPYEEAAAHLALGDIAVAPKMSLTEGNGKIYNYMAMGKPVVAFDAAANREILEDLGMYAKFGSADDLANRIIDLLNDSDSARSTGASLRRRAVRHLSWENRIHELLTVYQQELLDFIPAKPVRPTRNEAEIQRMLVTAER